MVKKSLYEARVINNYDTFSFHQYHISLPQTFIHIYPKALCLVFFFIFSIDLIYGLNIPYVINSSSRF